MWDVRAAEVAGRQFNRISRAQLEDLGMTKAALEHRLETGRFVVVDEGVIAVAPVLDDDWGRWMGATLTAPGSVLSHVSAAAAYGFWDRRRDFEIVTRPGSGGPRRMSGVLVYRSSTLDGDRTTLRGIPITTPERTLLDLAVHVRPRALARALREAIRLRWTTMSAVADCLGRHHRRRGARKLALALARYSGLPLERARSGAEVRAMEILKHAGLQLPELNRIRAGEEADLSWARLRQIIEIDGGPFHLDVGEDERKEGSWNSAGWTVQRIDADDIYERPERLVALAHAANVPTSAL
jgi:hypothetical protein